MSEGQAAIEGFAALLMRLRAEGITNIALLKAVEATPRVDFVPAQFTDAVWSERTIPLDCGAFLEGADLCVKLLDLLDIKEGQRILEVGTGSGYLAAIMGRLCERVVSIDRYRTLTEAAHRRFSRLGLDNIVTRQADGRRGLAGEGTFDRILVTAAFDAMPRQFVDHLVSDGIMLAPIMQDDGSVVLARLTKIGSRFEREDLFEVPYLPLVAGQAAVL